MMSMSLKSVNTADLESGSPSDLEPPNVVNPQPDPEDVEKVWELVCDKVYSNLLPFHILERTTSIGKRFPLH